MNTIAGPSRRLESIITSLLDNARRGIGDWELTDVGESYVLATASGSVVVRRLPASRNAFDVPQFSIEARDLAGDPIEVYRTPRSPLVRRDSDEQLAELVELVSGRLVDGDPRLEFIEREIQAASSSGA